MDHNGGRMLPIASAICALPLSRTHARSFTPVPRHFRSLSFSLSLFLGYPSPFESPSGWTRSTPPVLFPWRSSCSIFVAFSHPRSNVRTLEASDPRASPLPDSTTRRSHPTARGKRIRSFASYGGKPRRRKVRCRSRTKNTSRDYRRTHLTRNRRTESDERRVLARARARVSGPRVNQWNVLGGDGLLRER